LEALDGTTNHGGKARKDPGIASPQSRHAWLITAFEKHHNKLYHFILRKMGSVEEADELTQDVYVRLIRYKRPEAIVNLEAFLLTTASNLVRDRIRRLHARCHNLHDSLDDVSLDSGERLERQLETDQQVEILQKAIRELDVKSRKALLLHRFERWTHAQIAKEMETTIGVVRRYIDHAVAQCQDQVIRTNDLRPPRSLAA
jgi:RNA polymerase sigma-70 factor (ECF subfamily)